MRPLVKGKTAWFYDLRHLRHPLASRDLHVTCSPLSSARALNQQDRNAHVLRSRCYRATINLNQLLRGHRSIVVNHPTYINFCDVTGTQFRRISDKRDLPLLFNKRLRETCIHVQCASLWRYTTKHSKPFIFWCIWHLLYYVHTSWREPLMRSRIAAFK